MKACLSGKLGGLSQNFSSGKQILQIELDEDFREYYDEFKEKDLAVEIKPKVERRSKDANAFLWATIGDISGKTGIPPEEVYKQMIPDVGDNYETLPVKTEHKDRFIRAWEHQGIGWLTRDMGASKIEGYTNVMVFLGSSQYDKAQMSRIIDLALQECRTLGIPPRLTKQEIEATIERWGTI